MCIYLANDNSLSFTDSNSVVFNGNFNVSGLSKFSTVFTKLELVEESVEVFFCLVSFVDLLINYVFYFVRFVGSFLFYVISIFYYIEEFVIIITKNKC
jgi:hypothetical protein